MTEHHFIVQGTDARDPLTGETLYWSNEDGWVGLADATIFAEHERNTLSLPIGGAWIQAPSMDESKPRAIDSIEVPLVLSLSTQRIADLMVTAIEGSVNYWCNGVELRQPNRADVSESPWYASPELYADPRLALVVSESDDPEGRVTITHTIGLDDIRRGFALMAEKYGKHFHDFLTENEDAVTADVWLQLVTLGEVIYG